MTTRRDAVAANRLGALVTALGDRVEAAFQESVGHSGTSAAALLVVAQQPGCSIELLRRALGLSHSATVRVVDRLAGEGLVVREPGARGPAVALHVTDSGHDAAQRLERARLEVLQDALKRLGASRRAQVLSAVDDLLTHLTQAPETTSCRRCSVALCMGQHCPVVERQLALGRAEPPHAEPL